MAIGKFWGVGVSGSLGSGRVVLSECGVGFYFIFSVFL